MQHRLMTDSDVFADAERVAWVGVQYRTVLNVAAVTYFDVFVVTAQHGLRPYARVLAEVHLANDRRAVGGVGAVVYLGRMLAQRVNRHEFLSACGAASWTSITSSKVMSTGICPRSSRPSAISPVWATRPMSNSARGIPSTPGSMTPRRMKTSVTNGSTVRPSSKTAPIRLPTPPRIHPRRMLRSAQSSSNARQRSCFGR